MRPWRPWCGGLAAPGGAADRHDRRGRHGLDRGEYRDQRVDQAVAGDEVGDVDGKLAHGSRLRHVVGRGRLGRHEPAAGHRDVHGRGGDVQRRVAGQDPGVYPPQPGARFQAQLRHQRLAATPVHLQGVGAPSAPVQRQHEPLAQLLPQRLVVHPPVQLGYQLAVAAQRQRGVQVLALDPQPLLGQLGDGRVQARAVGVAGQVHVGVRRSSPQRERRGEALDRGGRPVGAGQRGALRRVPVERLGVQLARTDREPVAAGRGLDRPGQYRAQPPDQRLDLAQRGVRRVVGPQRAQQPVGGRAAVGVHEQYREQPTLPAAAQAHRRRAPRASRAPGTPASPPTHIEFY